MRLSPGHAQIAFAVLERALASKDPMVLAGDIAAFLATEHGAALCGVHFREEGAERAAVATTLSESATELHLDRAFPDGRPESVTVTTVAPAPTSGLAISRWTRPRAADTGTLDVFWMGRAIGLECLLEAAGETLATALDRALEMRRLERLATLDPLTNLANARAFRSALTREHSRSDRYGTRVSLVLVDLDDFKSINDRSGHLEGDRVLVEVSKVVRAAVRDTDLVARLGGDELAILMPESDAAAAQIAARRILDAVATVESAGGPVRASVGVAEHRAVDRHPDAMIEAADRALYRAKREGGNRVSMDEPLRNVA